MICSLFAAFLLLTPSAWAWGKQGHEIVGNMAWFLLSESTKDQVVSILNWTKADENDEDCTPLGSIADWADTVRRWHEYSWSAPLHFIDVRDDLIEGGCRVDHLADACIFDYERDCVDDMCVAGAIMNYTASLHRDLDDVSLKFLTHFVGDIHQPLHASRTTDRGGNTIHVHFPTHPSTGLRHRKVNLHSVWDDFIIERCMNYDHGESRTVYEKSLFEDMMSDKSTANRQHWLSCGSGLRKDCVTAWGKESVSDAFSYAYQNVDGTDIEDGTTLSDEYYVTRLPVVERRLQAAAIRLATTLESALCMQDC